MGSVVYRGMDQKTLNAAYNNVSAVKNSSEIIQSWVRQSQAFNDGYTKNCQLRYGSLARKVIDFFISEVSSATLFILGGEVIYKTN